MFKYIYNLFFPSEEQRLATEIKRKYKQAIELQRNGNIKGYSMLMNEVINLEDELVRLKDDSGN